jgi:hypothetical protein
MHKIPVIRLYFPLDALHVSDYVSPSSGATLETVRRIWYMPIRLAVPDNHNNFVRFVGLYTY